MAGTPRPAVINVGDGAVAALAWLPVDVVPPGSHGRHRRHRHWWRWPAASWGTCSRGTTTPAICVLL